MKKTQRYEKRLAAAREDAIGVMERYKAEIAREKVRQNASHNAFVKTCCLADHRSVDGGEEGD